MFPNGLYLNPVNAYLLILRFIPKMKKKKRGTLTDDLHRSTLHRADEVCVKKKELDKVPVKTPVVYLL